MKIFLEPRMITPKHAAQLRAAFPNVVFTEDAEDRSGVDAIFCHPAFAVKSMLDRYPDLAWVQIMMAGFNVSDIPEMNRRGILVTNMKDIFHISIAEDVFMKILTINRNVRHYLEAMKEGRWEPVRHEPEIYGSTVGILGTGSIGTAIATRMKAFGAHTLGYRRKIAPAGGFDEIVTGPEGMRRLLSESDYVVLCLPLSDATAGLIGKAEFALMKPEAVFVNVGRGEVVDQEALVEALRDKRLRGVGLDVMTPEPLPPDHPLWRFDNVVITPHNASSSPFVWPRITAVLHANIQKRLANEPLLNRVEE